MAIIKKTTAKAKPASSKILQKLLKVHALRDDLHIPPVNPLPRGQAKRDKRQAKQDRRLRLERMHHSTFADSIFGLRPVFPGQIVIPSADDARLPDSARMQDLEPLLHTGVAQVYWVDGSEAKGFLGAGIVWQAEGKLISGRCHLGQNTGGNNGDSELLALGAALRQAKKYIQQGNKVEFVRVFSDALTILEDIKQGTCYVLGPMQGGRTALEKLFARAQWLKERNVSIELTWVKGHANSEGNRLADEAAGQAIAEQASNPPPPTRFFSMSKTELEVPQVWRDRGQDWIMSGFGEPTALTSRNRRSSYQSSKRGRPGKSGDPNGSRSKRGQQAIWRTLQPLLALALMTMLLLNSTTALTV
jgi:ribonuclease HI